MTIAPRQHRPQLYRRSRPPYADQVVEFALSGLEGVRSPVVADIGCGTGLSTRPFHRIAGELVGVEPDAGMRAVATETLAAVEARVVAGSAENTGLLDHSVDLLVAASCFEWFDMRRAAREFRRVLSPRGRVLLMWNHRVVVDEVTFEWDQLWLRHMGPRIGHYPQDIETLLVPAFLRRTPVRQFRQVVPHPYGLARLVQFAQSSAYAPRHSQPRRRRMLASAIESFHERHAIDGEVWLTFETVAFLGTPLCRRGTDRA